MYSLFDVVNGIQLPDHNYALISLSGVGMKVPQLLQHFEHLVSPLAQALQCWAQEFGAKSVVAEVVR